MYTYYTYVVIQLNIKSLVEVQADIIKKRSSISLFNLILVILIDCSLSTIFKSVVWLLGVIKLPQIYYCKPMLLGIMWTQYFSSCDCELYCFVYSNKGIVFIGANSNKEQSD